MYELPQSVEINGELFRIRDDGDFRMVLHCFEILNAEDLNDKERVIGCLMLFYDQFDDVDDVLRFPYMEEATKKMFRFMNCDQEEQESKSSDFSLIDWDKDSMMITSAINNVAGKEIRQEKYLHWWTFMGYYMAIGDCPLTNIVSIRHKIAHNEKLEKHEKKFKQENPQFFNIDLRSASQKEADDYINKLWEGGES